MRRIIPLLVAVGVSLVGFPRLAVADDTPHLTPAEEEVPVSESPAPSAQESRFAPSSTTW